MSTGRGEEQDKQTVVLLFGFTNFIWGPLQLKDAKKMRHVLHCCMLFIDNSLDFSHH